MTVPATIGLDEVDALYHFLRGEMPTGMVFQVLPRLSEAEAFSVIYYLQERLRVLPDSIEQCATCGLLFDSREGGEYRGGKNYCEWRCYQDRQQVSP